MCIRDSANANNSNGYITIDQLEMRSANVPSQNSIKQVTKV